MKKISKNKLVYALFATCLSLLFAGTARAFCPVCTVAAASAVGLSRWLGVDDTISGLWLGALTVSMIGWTFNWMRKKEIKNSWYLSTFVVLLYYALILIPFYKTDIISFHPANMLWGVDKLLLGMIIGSAFFFLGHTLYLYLKKKNDGHAHFPFEKIVIPVGVVVIWNIIFHYITKR